VPRVNAHSHFLRFLPFYARLDLRALLGREPERQVVNANLPTLQCFSCGSKDLTPGDSGRRSACARCGSLRLCHVTQHRDLAVAIAEGAHPEMRVIPKACSIERARELFQKIHQHIDSLA
jgi:hypothetical protein